MAETLAEVYRDTFPALVRFLYRKVWDTDRAEDLAQEAFLRAAKHKPAKLKAWVFVVAANLARDAARTDIRRRDHLTLLKGEPQAAPATPDAEVEREEELARVRGALDALSPREREILLLWDSGHSYAEIAEHTGLSVRAIGTTLARARQHLCDAYDSTGARHAARG